LIPKYSRAQIYGQNNRPEIEQNLDRPDDEDFAAEDHEAQRDECRVQASHVGLPIEKDRPIPFQDMASHQANNRFICIKGESPYAQKGYLQNYGEEEQTNEYPYQ
jgi:hypothetical protein